MASYAIVPAAGKSRRMGQPKLELPFRDSTLLAVALNQWLESQVSKVIVVVRPGSERLRASCPNSDRVQWVEAEDPPHMKDSVQAALRYLQSSSGLSPDDRWLLAPADLPFLSPAVIDRLLEVATTAGSGNAPRIWVPVRQGRRGHPVVFCGSLAREVGDLGPDQGVNVLLDRWPVAEVAFGDELQFQDVDTPEDYRRAKERG